METMRGERRQKIACLISPILREQDREWPLGQAAQLQLLPHKQVIEEQPSERTVGTLQDGQYLIAIDP
jgi:hypothetical protein